MAQGLTLHDHVQPASHDKILQSMVQVQKLRCSVHGPCTLVDAKIIRNCHSNLMSTGSVVDNHRSSHPSASRLDENVQMIVSFNPTSMKLCFFNQSLHLTKLKKLHTNSNIDFCVQRKKQSKNEIAKKHMIVIQKVLILT